MHLAIDIGRWLAAGVDEVQYLLGEDNAAASSSTGENASELAYHAVGYWTRRAVLHCGNHVVQPPAGLPQPASTALAPGHLFGPLRSKYQKKGLTPSTSLDLQQKETAMSEGEAKVLTTEPLVSAGLRKPLAPPP